METNGLSDGIRNPNPRCIVEKYHAPPQDADARNEIEKLSQMTYRDFHKNRWDCLATEFGGSSLGAVIAEHNDRVNYYFDKTTKKILRRALNVDHKSVLDLGCGIGRLSVWLASKAALVTGLDISEEMIRVARHKAVSQGARNTSFAVYDGTALPFGDGSFDVAVCCAVLKYVVDDGDLSTIIKEMCRAVGRGGQVVVIDEFHSAGPVELHGEQDIGRLSVLRRPTDYIRLFQKHGMELVDQCTTYRKLFQYRAENVLQNWQLGRLIVAWPLVTCTMAIIDVLVDDMLRHRSSSERSFEMLVFVRHP